jgi:hypothetical protein
MAGVMLYLCRIGLHNWIYAHNDEGGRYAVCTRCGKDDYRGDTSPDEGPNWPGKQW